MVFTAWDVRDNPALWDYNRVMTYLPQELHCNELCVCKKELSCDVMINLHKTHNICKLGVIRYASNLVQQYHTASLHDHANIKTSKSP